jgi:PAS domain S-box-containing protein
MPLARWVQYAVLLVLVAAPVSVPGLQTTSYGGWPAVGVAVALFLAAGRRDRWAVMVVATLVAGTALALSYDVAVWLGWLGGLAVILPSLLTAHLLEPSGRGRIWLEHVEVVPYHLITALSALLCGLASTLSVLVIETPRHVLLTGLMSFLAALTAQLTVLPVLMRSPRDLVSPAGHFELTCERVLLFAVVWAVFWPNSRLGVAFLVFPLLGWAALRASRRETHLQLFAVAVTAYALTFLGHGPLAGKVGGLPDDLAPALLYLFIAAACYLTVPLSMTVERLVRVTDQATRAASTIERMLDSATGTLFIATDVRGLITHYNSGAANALGYSFDEVVGRSPKMFHTAEEIARQAQHFGVPTDHKMIVLAQVKSGDRHDWEFRHKDGSARITSLSLSEIMAPSGYVQGYIATGEDITERMRAQEVLEAALEREHASVLRLQEVDHVKQELVSNVSHELRTPITSISGYTELLAEGDLGELNAPQVDAVERIGRNTERLGVLVEDLLTLSRAEAGELALAGDEVDLRSATREAFDLMEEQLRSRSLLTRLRLPDRPVVVRGDGAALERVAVNLIGNAVKFTPDGGRITVRVKVDGGEAVLEVADTGLGIPEEDQQHLFTRFFRASVATERAIQGSGLGLSIVHAIVTRHGGQVTVDSSPGVGTTVRVRLPVVRR